MGGSFKIGRLSGIGVRVHWTFFLLLAFFAFVGYQASGSLAGALTATAMIVALFICVLLHEFGHSLVAQRLGIEIHSITLLPIGGVSNLKPPRSTPTSQIPWPAHGNVVLARSSRRGLLLGPNLEQPNVHGSVGGPVYSIWLPNVVLALQHDTPPSGRARVAGVLSLAGTLRARRSLEGWQSSLLLLREGSSWQFLLALMPIIFFGVQRRGQMVNKELTAARLSG